ncbi:MAG: IS1634 family transposase [Melioribacteraceae bacterium]|nr:IS1634 family transposase [Melioribacteraceae bacterium]
MSEFHIRTTKTSSKAKAVQVVRYENRRMIIVKHIGSSHNPDELIKLKLIAREYIDKLTKQPSLFPNEQPKNLVNIKDFQYLGFRYGLLYETLHGLCKRFNFHRHRNQLLVDLVIARIIQPGSKLQAIEFLKEFLGIEHRREYFYRDLPKMKTIKEPIAQKILSIAKKEFNFNFSLIFYDVTTLYFESDRADDFRKPGFSKDNKFNQPQIVLGLIVTKEGFPLWYQIFEGNKFEGHTLIPIIKDFKKKHKIDTITVVADAAMISSENIKLLSSASLNYIVGARLANLRLSLIKTVSAKLKNSDGKTVRVKTELGDLICEYSEKRYRKDKREMDKYIKKAESLIKEPGKIKRAKYVKVQNQSYQLNKTLIEKNELLLGIKGYYTNLELSEVEDKTIIEHYHNLWQIEHAFRITKSDLQIRPIYHRKKEIIEVHVLICFMALAVCKYMELKTEQSTQSILKQLKSVTDARIKNRLSGQEVILRSEINSDIELILKNLRF